MRSHGPLFVSATAARVVVPLVALVLALALVPATLAQDDHQHAQDGVYVVVTHDVPDDGRTYVGNLNHFGWVLFGEDGRPLFHHNVVFEVVHNGVTLLKSEPSSGHDYDGVGEMAVAFPTTGEYEVTVTVPTNDGDVSDTFTGYVVPGPLVAGQLTIEGPGEATVGDPATFTYQVLGPDGMIIPHSDALFSVRRGDDGYELFRTHTHTHEDSQQLSYAFQAPGTYELVVTGYHAFPTENARAFVPVTARQTVEVTDGVPVVGPAMALGPPTRPPLENAVDDGTSDAPFALYGTYDPYTSTGPYGVMRLTAVVVNETSGMPVPHVDFDATLTGPGGAVLFESATLHEYDGVFDLKTRHHGVGDYTLTLTASRGDWSGELLQTYSILPPVVPLAVGPQFTTVEGTDELVAGEPASMELVSTNAAGLPFQHSEMDLRVVDGAGNLVYATKLHTHSDGRFPFTLTLPEPGTYELQVDPHALEPSATVPGYYGASLGEPTTYAFSVAEGPGIPEVAVDTGLDPLDADGPSEDVPALGPVATVLAGLMAVLVAVRRRRAR